MGSRIAILFLAVASLLAQNNPQTDDGQSWVNQGIQAFKSARYPEAIDAFQKAVDLNPANVKAHLYLGSAYMISYIPGASSPENSARAERAEAEFQRVLQLDPNERVALGSLGSLYYQESQAAQDKNEKLRKLDQSQDTYKKMVALDPNDKEAYYSMGVIAWSKSYPDRMTARAQIGMRPEDPGPITNAAERQALKNKYDRVVEEGISNLEKALQIDPKYDDAMAYMNLLIRGRADLRDTQEAYRQDVTTADAWVQKALETKKEKQTGTPPATPQRIRVGGNVAEQNLISRVEPVYPPLALQARIQGVVKFSAIIGKDGRIINLQLISGHPLLVAAAQDAVRQYLYKPTLLNGEPVEVVTQIDVNFNLQ